MNKKTVFLLISISVILGISCAGRSATFEYKDIELGIAIEDTPEYIEIISQEDTLTGGLIFYPGGLVQPKAYVKMLAPIADRMGYRILIMKMPFNLAIMDTEKALRFIDSFRETSEWIIAGHSLGGATAAMLVNKHPDLFKGIIFLASYPPESDSLADNDIPALTIYGTEDGLATLEKVKKHTPYLPPDTEHLRIEGGNHAQFGSYGPQDGDGEAQISEKEQHEIVGNKMIEFLYKVFTDKN